MNNFQASEEQKPHGQPFNNCGKNSTITSMKRPYSPDYNQSQYLSARNYKRQKLLQDFERLTLGSRNDKKISKHSFYLNKAASESREDLLTKVYGPGNISQELKTNIKDYLNSEFKKGHTLSESKIIDNIRQKFIESHMQLTKYVLWDRVIFKLWQKWYFRNYSFYSSTGKEEMLVDNDEHMLMDSNIHQQSQNDQDEDVEMG